MSDPFASIYLRVQSFWFWARSKPGLQSQATPPLGVSRQMWAQPWSLFMQFIPSGKRQTRGISAVALCSSDLLAHAWLFSVGVLLDCERRLGSQDSSGGTSDYLHLL